ncbi:MAG: ketopantoate reductase family protein [Halobacteriales archaeon]|nr:ketopantoate reductase family protein [Halobacteriales archaeon]
MEVVVFGAGSLGSLVGGLLARAHDVTLVGRDPHMRAVREGGLRVTGVEAFTAEPEATTDGEGLAADLAVVTVKAYDTPEAAAALATGEFGAALSLQNGMGNEATLAEALDCPVLGGSISHGAVRREPGTVEWTGRGEVALGAWTSSGAERVDAVAEAFEAAGLNPRVVGDVRAELWGKLAVNTAINPVTALARRPNGAVRDGDAGELAAEAARETARVAAAEGVELSEAEAVDRVAAVAEATAANRSSMLEDVTAGRRTEIDQLNGYVVDRAADHDLEVPVNRTLTTLVRAWETGEALR